MTPSGIDMAELLTFIEPNIVTRERNENFTFVADKSKRYISSLRPCKKSDFESRGFVSDKEEANPYKYRLCPDVTEENKEQFILKNLYANHKERINFAMEIYKCQNSTTKQCKDDATI